MNDQPRPQPSEFRDSVRIPLIVAVFLAGLFVGLWAGSKIGAANAPATTAAN